MSSKPWFAWYPADYKAKTSHLSYVEDNAYRRLIDAYYEHGGPLTSDRPSLFRICGAMLPEEQAAIEAVVNQFFFLNDNELHNKRCDDEIAKQAIIHARLSEAGKLGGMLGGKGRPKPTPKQSHIHNHISQYTSTSTETPPKRERGTRGKPKSNSEIVALPDWLPLDHWRTFLEMRQKTRKPASARAQRMLISKLSDLKDQGYSPAQLLAESELKCWSSIYEPKS